MDKPEFSLHEDEWGMVSVMPAENMARSREVAQEAEEFGREHAAGVGWTDIYVIPEEEHSISEREIKLEELRGLIGGRLAEAGKVLSGYTGSREEVATGFAFGRGYPPGAFYGSQDGGVITSLNVILPDGRNEAAVALFEDILGSLGRKYGLMLANWWANEVVDLSDSEGLRQYLLREDR